MIGKELWHNQKESWLKSVDVEEIQSHQVMVKSIRSLVSSGTEKLVLTTPLNDITSDAMSLPSMKGRFSDEFTYGYSLVGEIVSGKDSLIGKFTHLLHPHQSYAIVDEQDLFLLPNKEFVNNGVLISNLETVINAIWDSNVSTGDNVLIVGYGIIGALLSKVIQRMPGVSVTISETNLERKKEASKQFEIKHDSVQGFDIVFNTSGTEEGMQVGLDELAKEGLLVELSWYGSKRISLHLGGSFHYDRKRIISSQVGSIPTKKSSRWNYKTRKKLALRLIREIDFSDLLTKEVPFEETPLFFNSLRKNEVNEIGIVIKY